MVDAETAVLDVAFELSGSTLPADHAEALAREVGRWLPWLGADPACGIHPLRTAATSGGMVVIARRAKLVLRVPASRSGDVRALCGRDLRVVESALTAGDAQDRPLAPWSTLYAHRVVTGATDEGAFHDDVARWLAHERIGCRFIAGRAKRVRIDGGDLLAFGLALHDLTPGDSLRVQAAGLGIGRTMGCGIFVPHKTIATPA